MSEILVLVDHVDGAVRKTTNELLTIARRLGEPSAVFIGSPSDDAVAAAPGEQGGGEPALLAGRQPQAVTVAGRPGRGLPGVPDQGAQPAP